jgi:hypothetical protein
MAENRKSERRLTLQTGKILGPDATFLIDCAILNLSVHGACILVPVGATVADRFRLAIDHDRKRRECLVAWRDGARIGVSFT